MTREAGPVIEPRGHEYCETPNTARLARTLETAAAAKERKVWNDEMGGELICAWVEMSSPSAADAGRPGMWS